MTTLGERLTRLDREVLRAVLRRANEREGVVEALLDRNLQWGPQLERNRLLEEVAGAALALRRREHSPADLPVHERHLGPPVGPDGDTPWPVVVIDARQPQPTVRIVPHRRHQAECFFPGIPWHPLEPKSPGRAR